VHACKPLYTPTRIPLSWNVSYVLWFFRRWIWCHVNEHSLKALRSKFCCLDTTNHLAVQLTCKAIIPFRMMPEILLPPCGHFSIFWMHPPACTPSQGACSCLKYNICLFTVLYSCVHFCFWGQNMTKIYRIPRGVILPRETTQIVFWPPSLPGTHWTGLYSVAVDKTLQYKSITGWMGAQSAFISFRQLADVIATTV